MNLQKWEKELEEEEAIYFSAGRMEFRIIGPTEEGEPFSISENKGEFSQDAQTLEEALQVVKGKLDAIADHINEIEW